MFLLGFADSIQADREREIAELIRSRRLLKPESEATTKDQPAADQRAAPRTSDARPSRVRARLTGS
jgi:hypothetical protein